MSNFEKQLFEKDSDLQLKGLQGLINLKEKPALEEKSRERIGYLAKESDPGVRLFARKLLKLHNLPVPFLVQDSVTGDGRTQQKVQKKQKTGVEFDDSVVVFRTMDFSDTAKIIPYFKHPGIENWDLTFLNKVFNPLREAYLNPLLDYLKSTKNVIHISFIIKNLGFYKKPELFEVIKGYLNHSDDRTVANAVEGLELLGDERAIPLFGQLTHHKNHRVVGNALRALGSHDSKVIKPILKKMLTSGKRQFMLSAIHTLGKLKKPDLLPLTFPLLLNEEYKTIILCLLDEQEPQKIIKLLNQALPKLKSSSHDKIHEILYEKLDQMENTFLEKQIEEEHEEKRIKYVDSQKTLDEDKVFYGSDNMGTNPGCSAVMAFIAMFSGMGIFMVSLSNGEALTSEQQFGIGLFICLTILFSYKTYLDSR